jgi:hypothetical protein
MIDLEAAPGRQQPRSAVMINFNFQRSTLKAQRSMLNVE